MGAGVNSHANKGPPLKRQHLIKEANSKSSGANTARNAPPGSMADSGQSEKALP